MIAGANAATVILMILVGYSDRLSPEYHPLLSSLGLFFPLFLFVNIAFLFFWLLFKKRYTLISFVGMLAGYGPVHTYLPINPQKEVPDSTVKILSFNTLSMGECAMGEDGVNPVVDYVRRMDADIVCLQEALTNTEVKQQIDSILGAHYPYIRHTYHPNGSGNAIMLLSKFPVLSEECVDYPSAGNLSVAYQLRIKGRKVLLISNHLETTGISLEERREFKTLIKGKMETHEAETTSRALLARLAEAACKRAPQAEAVARYVCEHPLESVIVCGDFNDGPISYAHHTIAQGLTDCFVASGNGLGISYHRSGFYVRIDNILCSPDCTPYDCKVDDKIDVSDHYPILCRLKIPSNH